jgi:hypothetical protein
LGKARLRVTTPPAEEVALCLYIYPEEFLM